MPKELSARFRPGWWVFCLGRNEETNETLIVSLDLKKRNGRLDANRASLASLRPLSMSGHVHYAVIEARYILDPEHLRAVQLTYELQWSTTAAASDPVSMRLELEKLRRFH